MTTSFSGLENVDELASRLKVCNLNWTIELTRIEQQPAGFVNAALHREGADGSKKCLSECWPVARRRAGTHGVPVRPSQYTHIASWSGSYFKGGHEGMYYVLGSINFATAK